MLRNKSQQYHEGVKIVRKNLGSISKMMEYLVKLKEELNTDGQIKEMKSTSKSLDEITNYIKEIYSNYKKIK
jgi:archaellum component FlaC